MARIDDLKAKLVAVERAYDKEASKKKPDKKKLADLAWEIKSLEQQIDTARNGGY